MQEHLHDFWQAVLEYWFVIAMILTTTLMAIFRTAKKHGRVDWIESAMCALFAYGIWFVLTWLNLPEGAGVLIGGFIGYFGTHKTSQWLSKRLGIDLEDKE